MRVYPGAHIDRPLFAKYPELLGNLFSPGSYCRPQGHWAIDNGAFGAWVKNKPWDEATFVRLLERSLTAPSRPDWVVCPDVVADKDATIAKWQEWQPTLAAYKIPIAFAVQDGMNLSDVPSNADLVFVGGTTEWKWANYQKFCSNFPTHVARVNTYKRLWLCHHAGAISVDGTGWFRKSKGWSSMSAPLYDYLAIISGEQLSESDLLFPVYPYITAS